MSVTAVRRALLTTDLARPDGAAELGPSCFVFSLTRSAVDFSAVDAYLSQSVVIASRCPSNLTLRLLGGLIHEYELVAGILACHTFPMTMAILRPG